MIKRKMKIVSLGLAISLVIGGVFFVGINSIAASTRIIGEYDVVVIGGGVAGLTSAYFLDEDDKDVLVLEKKDKVGGRTISAMHKSFTYAKGTEYLGTPESSLTYMIDELDLEPKKIPSPMDAYFDGSSFYYGSDGIKRYLINNSSSDDYKEFVQLLLDGYDYYDEIPDIDYNAHAKYLDNISADKWLRENKIPEVFTQKYNVASKGLFGANMNEISALSFIPEGVYDYEGDSAQDYDDDDYADYDLEDLKQEYRDAKNEDSGSYSFEKGLTEFTNKLSEVLDEQIKLNSTVISVEKDGYGYEITYLDNTKNKKYAVWTENVVLAVPAPEALKIAPSVLSEEKVEIMENIKYSSYATVALFSDTPIFDKAFDLAVPDDYYFTDVYDATWIEKYYDKEKQNKKEYITSVYVAPKSVDDHTLDVISDEDMIQNIYNDLNKIFPDASNKVTGYDIERFPYAYPVMSLGAYERLLTLDELNYGSLILAGDYMSYPTFEAAVESGHLAANRIIEGY